MVLLGSCQSGLLCLLEFLLTPPGLSLLLPLAVYLGLLLLICFALGDPLFQRDDLLQVFFEGQLEDFCEKGAPLLPESQVRGVKAYEISLLLVKVIGLSVGLHVVVWPRLLALFTLVGVLAQVSLSFASVLLVSEDVSLKLIFVEVVGEEKSAILHHFIFVAAKFVDRHQPIINRFLFLVCVGSHARALVHISDREGCEKIWASRPQLVINGRLVDGCSGPIDIVTELDH